MSLSPLDIHNWATKYNISPSWVWELIEVCTDDLSDVEDEAWLLDNAVSYIESVDLEPFHDHNVKPISFSHLRHFYIHTLPVIDALVEYMTREHRMKIHYMSRNLPLTNAVDAVMYPR